MEERPTELQQSALAAEPAGWAVCEWAAGLWGRGLSVDGHAGSPAPLAQSSSSTARTSRSEYVSDAARYRLLPRTERAPEARDPSSASVDCAPKTATTCALCLPSHRTSSHQAPGSSWTGRSRFPRERPAGIYPKYRVGRHLGYRAARRLCAPSLPGSLGLCASLLLRAPPRPAGAARLGPSERPGLWPEPARRRGFCRCSLRFCYRCCCPPAAGRWKVSGVWVPRATGKPRSVGPRAEHTSKEALCSSRLLAAFFGGTASIWTRHLLPKTAVWPWVFVEIAYSQSRETRPSGFLTSGRRGNVGDPASKRGLRDWALGRVKRNSSGWGLHWLGTRCS